MNKLHEQGLDIVLRKRFEEKVEKEKHKIYPETSVIPKIKKEFKDLGFNIEIYEQIETLGKLYPEITRDIVFKYYPLAKTDYEKCIIVNALENKKNLDLVPFFCNELVTLPNEEFYITSLLVGNFLMKISHKKYKDLYKDLLTNKKYKWGPKEDFRWCIILGTKKFKFEDFKDIYIDLLNVKKTACIQALDAYRDPNLKELFLKYLNDENDEARRVSKIALKHLGYEIKK